KISRAPARFDAADLLTLNAKLLQRLSYDDVADQLRAQSCDGGAEFWLAIRGNIQRVRDAVPLWEMINAPITPVIEDEDVTQSAVRHLPDGELSADVWSTWMDAVKADTGRKGKALFMPIRLALTGAQRGPELAPLLPLMGRDRVVKRLSGERA
ncbi:MAG: glutamate--tRNA ligase, partial [Pseudomonadota bacterium]